MNNNTVKISSALYDRWARSTYDRFRILQPQVETKGLWQNTTEAQYFIHCPNLDEEKTKDGQALSKWFDYHCRPVTSRIELVSNIPLLTKKIEERSHKELIQLSGEVLNVDQFTKNFLLLTPITFPEIIIKDDPQNQKIVIFVKQKLTNNEISILEQVLHKIQIDFECQITIDPEKFLQRKIPSKTPRKGDIDLIPSKLLPKSIPNQIKKIWEEEEEFWVDNRVKLLRDNKLSHDEILPPKWRSQLQSSCLIDATVFPPANLRNYLTLYQNVIIAPPIIGASSSEIYTALGITESELAELVKIGRVKLIFPHSIENYSPSLISPIAESSPENILLSRRLASATILETRQRCPMLYPTLDIENRQLFLRSLELLVGKINDPYLQKSIALIKDVLTEVWLSSEQFLNFRGAMANDVLGVGRIAGELVHAFMNIDVRLELWHASRVVEWGGALNATVFPTDNKGYSEVGHSAIAASIYTGVPQNITPDYSFKINKLVDGILAINKDIPVIDFATSFHGPDIDRLRHVISNMANHNLNQEELEYSLSKFNQEVVAYEKRTAFLSKIDMNGLILAMPAVVIPKIGGWVTLGMWAIKTLSKYRSNSLPLGTALDIFESALTNTTPHAVLIGRIKKKIK